MSIAEPSDYTVLHSRSVADLERVQVDLMGAGLKEADLFLNFVRETSHLAHDEEALLAKVREFIFLAFPQASHMAIVTLNNAAEKTVEMNILASGDRDGDVPAIPLSRTLVNNVIRDGVALLYTNHADAVLGSASLQLSRIEGAICAPLWNRVRSFGVIQIDIRHPAKGAFTRKDVDRLALFAHYLALGLDNLQLYRDQTSAFESTIEALMHTLLLKDPDTAAHSRRVQQLALYLGRTLKLNRNRMQVLSVAALLHDMGKQGVRDELLFKSSKFSSEEKTEMDQHASMTQGILDRIRYPAHLHQVPEIAAYHHEKMDGSGPYQIAGDKIPFESRIISVADCFDALISARAYKQPMTPAQIQNILQQGRGTEWDPGVIDALLREMPGILVMLYDGGQQQHAA